jgi:hypothetical protein
VGTASPATGNRPWKWRHLCCCTAQLLSTLHAAESISGFAALGAAEQSALRRLVAGELVGNAALLSASPAAVAVPPPTSVRGVVPLPLMPHDAADAAATRAWLKQSADYASAGALYKHVVRAARAPTAALTTFPAKAEAALLAFPPGLMHDELAAAVKRLAEVALSPTQHTYCDDMAARAAALPTRALVVLAVHLSLHDAMKTAPGWGKPWNTLFHHAVLAAAPLARRPAPRTYPTHHSASLGVQLAKSGSLAELQRHIAAAPDVAAGANAALQWVESEDDRYGGTKSWTWYSDTPLIAAARAGQPLVVRYLLHDVLADPTLQSCPSDDVYESALQAARNDGCKLLLQAAAPFWQRAPYANPHGSSGRAMTNQPLDPAGLRAAIGAVPEAALAVTGNPPPPRRVAPPHPPHAAPRRGAVPRRSDVGHPAHRVPPRLKGTTRCAVCNCPVGLENMAEHVAGKRHRSLTGQ